jgi:hypothetical protein
MIECEICRTFHAVSLDEHTSDSMVVLGAAPRALPGCGACAGERSICDSDRLVSSLPLFSLPTSGFAHVIIEIKGAVILAF